MQIVIDQRLLADTFIVTDLELSRVLLKNDKDNPWFILVPKIKSATELIDLSSEEQVFLMEEINLLSHFLKEYYRPFKINVASLGNVVPQLHIHVIARFSDDRAWPNPIWNTPVVSFFEREEVENIKSNFLDYIS